MLFGRTEKEILTALEFYDKHSEEVKKYDLTREEARKQVFNKVKNWEGFECSNFVLALEALGLIKFKENENENENIIAEARRLSYEYIEYDHKNPANRISQMSRIIGRLLEIIEGHKK